MTTSTQGQAEQGDFLREFFKRWPGFYYLIVDIFGPLYFGGLNPKGFIRKYAREGVRLNLGSGPRVIDTSFVNIDGEAYRGVDQVADITHLPHEDNSVAMTMCDNVLEHVREPRAAVAEMYRVLETGGVAYIAAPFLYPFHSSPSDYQRWTKRGLLELCSAFEVVEIGVRSGPFSVLSTYLIYLFASLLSFGSRKLHKIVTNMLIFVFFPIKYLDIIGNHLPFASDIASDFYIVLRKN